MWLMTAISSSILFGLAGVWMKISQMRGGSTRSMLLGLYASGSIGFTVHSALEGSLHSLSSSAVWIAGIVIGVGSAWGNLLFMQALKLGPASLTSPLTNSNIVIVIALATWWYDEPLGLYEAIGIVLLLLAIILIAYKPREPLTIAEKRWFLIVAAAIAMFALRNGGLKVTEELGLSSAPILLIGYALSFLWFLMQGKPEQITAEKRSTGLGLGLTAGLFSYGGLQLYAIALATGKANLAAPIFATNSLVVAIFAIAYYKEKLSPIQWSAFLCLIAGLIIIRL